MKNQFLLREDIVFLNHGSFGACPKVVFNEYQKWQLELERQPVEFLGRRHFDLLKEVRIKLGQFVGSLPDNLVLISNTTMGINSIVKSLDLNANDEVLISDHEYGAVERLWKLLSQQLGFKLITVKIPIPLNNEEEFTKAFSDKISLSTKVIFTSQITSPTALVLPVDRICKIAREKGIITIVDGAHSPGQIPLNLDVSDFDFFVGNCHKWMLSPKGAAFLYVKPEKQKLLKPLIMSWGSYEKKYSDSEFIDEFEYLGTRDIASFLSVPASIDFINNEEFKEQIEISKELIKLSKVKFFEILKTPYLTVNDNFTGLMYSHKLPDNVNADSLKSILYDNYRIEIPVTSIGNQNFIRVSVQVYNNFTELIKLFNAIKEILKI